jgi:hypothetical protein
MQKESTQGGGDPTLDRLDKQGRPVLALYHILNPSLRQFHSSHTAGKFFQYHRAMAELLALFLSWLDLLLHTSGACNNRHLFFVNHTCSGCKQLESRMHYGSTQSSRLAKFLARAVIHVGSLICMRIVSNFAIAQDMVSSDRMTRIWKWKWHVEVVSVEVPPLVLEDRH